MWWHSSLEPTVLKTPKLTCENKPPAGAPLASLSINSLPRPTKLKVEKAQVEKAQVEKSKVPESSRSYTASVTKGDSRAEKIKKPSAARPSLE